MRWRYGRLDTLGSDRALNCYGARHLVGGDCVVADFGTAVTLDGVSRSGVFEGGVILPGLQTSLRALSGATALLPPVRLRGRAAFPGRSTAECLRLGALLGCAAVTGAVCEAFRKRFAVRKLNLIVTGGDGLLILPYVKGLKGIRLYHDPLFLLKSIRHHLKSRGEAAF
jgi:type III pantothenate kinase